MKYNTLVHQKLQKILFLKTVKVNISDFYCMKHFKEKQFYNDII